MPLLLKTSNYSTLQSNSGKKSRCCVSDKRSTDDQRFDNHHNIERVGGVPSDNHLLFAHDSVWYSCLAFCKLPFLRGSEEGHLTDIFYEDLPLFKRPIIGACQACEAAEKLFL